VNGRVRYGLHDEGECMKACLVFNRCTGYAWGLLGRCFLYGEGLEAGLPPYESPGSDELWEGYKKNYTLVVASGGQGGVQCMQRGATARHRWFHRDRHDHAVCAVFVNESTINGMQPMLESPSPTLSGAPLVCLRTCMHMHWHAQYGMTGTARHSTGRAGRAGSEGEARTHARTAWQTNT
jgi:hypothetical protein